MQPAPGQRPGPSTPAACPKRCSAWLIHATCAVFRSTRSPTARRRGLRCRIRTVRRPASTTCAARAGPGVGRDGLRLVVAATSLSRARPAGRGQGGFTYLGVLLAIAVLGVGLVVASEVWVTSARRHKAEELKWIGAQFTQTIGSYYHSTPGAAKAYPQSLQELLEDRRNPTRAGICAGPTATRSPATPTGSSSRATTCGSAAFGASFRQRQDSRSGSSSIRRRVSRRPECFRPLNAASRASPAGRAPEA